MRGKQILMEEDRVKKSRKVKEKSKQKHFHLWPCSWSKLLKWRHSAVHLNRFFPTSCMLLAAMETDTPSLWDVPLQMDPAASERQHVFSCGG